MTQPGKQPCLAFERPTVLASRDQRLFDGNQVAQPSVGCFVDGTHATAPDQAVDTIPAAEQRSRFDHARTHHDLRHVRSL